MKTAVILAFIALVIFTVLKVKKSLKELNQIFEDPESIDYEVPWAWIQKDYIELRDKIKAEKEGNI